MTTQRFSRRHVLVLALFALCAVAVPVPWSHAGDPDQKEVTQRLEINAATREQLLGLGVLTPEQVDKLLELRQTMGDFQSYEELEDAGINKETIDKLRPLTTINYMATDCNC